jgi:site-specific DNA recombinase
VHHQGKAWPGQQEPIIARDLWDAVQKKLHDNKITAKTGTGRQSLLTGILFDETGDRLSPSHAVRSGRRYRYYVSRRLTQARRKDESGWRLPAEQLEKVVLAFIIDLLGDEGRLAKVIGRRDPELIRRALDRAAELIASGIEALAHRLDLIASILVKIIVAPQKLSFTVSNRGLCRVLGIPALETAEPFDTIIDLPFTLRRRRVETKLVIAGERQSPMVDPKLIEAIAQAHYWRDRLIEGISVADLARELGLDDGEISRVLSSAFLAPDIGLVISKLVDRINQLERWVYCIVDDADRIIFLGWRFLSHRTWLYRNAKSSQPHKPGFGHVLWIWIHHEIQ